MRYAVDTIDGLGFGKSDPYWRWTLRGALLLAHKLGPNARVRKWTRKGYVTVMEPLAVGVTITLRRG